MDEGKLLVLVLLDLSAVFDTIDHDTLLHCLHHVFGIQGTVLSWFKADLFIKDSKLFQFKVLIPTKLSCGVVYLRALF